MTTANQRGGYLKRLSISRDGESTSLTTFAELFLKKTDNYVLQIPRFVTSIMPPINLITEIMFEILPRGNVGVLPENAGANLLEGSHQFAAQPYRCWSELARQLQLFFDNADHVLGDNNEIKFLLLDDGCFRLKLSPDFFDIFYIKVGAETQKKTGFPEYMFQVRGTEDGELKYFDHTDGQEYLFDEYVNAGGDTVLAFAVYQDDNEEKIILIAASHSTHLTQGSPMI